MGAAFPNFTYVYFFLDTRIDYAVRSVSIPFGGRPRSQGGDGREQNALAEGISWGKPNEGLRRICGGVPSRMAESPSTLSRLRGAESQHGEVKWSPAAETSDANAIHGEIASSAPSQQAVMARGAE
jgi:hypothetical protein